MESTLSREQVDMLTALANGQTGVSEIVNGTLKVKLGLGAWDKVPPTTQPVAITNPAGGGTIDAEARTAVNGILAALRGAGIIAT